MQIRSVGAATALLVLPASAAHATILNYGAVLRGRYEVPPNTTSGVGHVRAVLDTDTGVLQYAVTYSGLTGPGIAAHFHGPAREGSDAPVVIAATNPASPVRGQAHVTGAEIGDLNSGNWYFNVHTRAFPKGEIRGWLMRENTDSP
jgi:hypothetical protein